MRQFARYTTTIRPSGKVRSSSFICEGLRNAFRLYHHHPGGVTALFGDGSFRFINNSFGPLTRVLLWSMASGEVISSVSY